MSAMMNTVSTEPIRPTSVMDLPFLDKNNESIVIPVKNKEDAVMILKEIRGY